MDIQKNDIDGGKAFDWGRTSSDYAKFRDIYPPLFFDKVAERGLCVKGQRVLDIGTGTGVVPRNMYHYGAEWTGADISENQIAQAKMLAQSSGMNIDFVVSATEKLDFPDETFDVITACQCFFYFDYDVVIPKLARLLKKGGRLLNFDSDYGLVTFSRKEEQADVHANIRQELVTECNDIKDELRISTHRRPEWDARFLRDLGMQVTVEEEIAPQVRTDKNMQFDTLPLFAIIASK